MSAANLVSHGALCGSRCGGISNILCQAERSEASLRVKIEVLRYRSSNGQLITVLPLALWSVLKATPGVSKFEAIQTAPEALRIRLER